MELEVVDEVVVDDEVEVATDAEEVGTATTEDEEELGTATTEDEADTTDDESLDPEGSYFL